MDPGRRELASLAPWFEAYHARSGAQHPYNGSIQRSHFHLFIRSAQVKQTPHQTPTASSFHFHDIVIPSCPHHTHVWASCCCSGPDGSLHDQEVFHLQANSKQRPF